MTIISSLRFYVHIVTTNIDGVKDMMLFILKHLKNYFDK